jgi:hypothetical protein
MALARRVYKVWGGLSIQAKKPHYFDIDGGEQEATALHALEVQHPAIAVIHYE